jgi:tripartite-type tricarboxylate transporter receptor subunit TctC
VNRAIGALWLVAFVLASTAAAQEWPSRPIRMVVGFGPGGGSDIVARILAGPLAEAVGGTIVVENKPGAGGTIAADQVAKSAPDGHTMFLMNNGHAVAAALYKQLPFDSSADFRGASLVATMPLVIVTAPEFGAKDLKALIEMAKRQPGKVNFGSVGIGSTQHFAGELFSQMAGIEFFHVPFKGTPNLLAALKTGDIHVVVEVLSAVLGQIKGGQLRSLAVTSAERFAGLPDVPCVAELGVANYNVATWYGVAFPAKTPEPIVRRTAASLRAALQSPEVQKQLANVGLTPVTSTPDETDRHVAAEIMRWKEVRAAAKIPQQ